MAYRRNLTISSPKYLSHISCRAENLKISRNNNEKRGRESEGCEDFAIVLRLVLSGLSVCNDSCTDSGVWPKVWNSAEKRIFRLVTAVRLKEDTETVLLGNCRGGRTIFNRDVQLDGQYEKDATETTYKCKQNSKAGHEAAVHHIAAYGCDIWHKAHRLSSRQAAKHRVIPIPNVCIASLCSGCLPCALVSHTRTACT